MYPPHLAYLKKSGTTWFNPSYGILGFWNEYWNLSRNLGKPHDFVWKHRDLKRAKEIYAMSIVAKTMAKQENKTWWMVKPEHDPPDGVIGTIIEKDGLPIMHVRELEIVEHITGNLIDTLRAKLNPKKKQYEPNTALVCFISEGGTYNLEEAAAILKEETTGLDHVFLVFPGQELSSIPSDSTNEELARALITLSCVQIKPIYSISTIDPLLDCKEFREGKEGAFYIFEGVGKGGSRPITLEEPPKLF